MVRAGELAEKILRSRRSAAMPWPVTLGREVAGRLTRWQKFHTAATVFRRLLSSMLSRNRQKAIARASSPSPTFLHCFSLWPPEGGWLRSTASRLARDETLRIRSFSCSTIVELFHLPSSVLIAMMTSSIVVVISNQWSAIHGMRVRSPLPAGVLKNSQGLAHVTMSWVKCGRNRRTRIP